jgi:hypothetical protein
MESVVFEVLSRGVIVSTNSRRFFEIAQWLSDRENFTSLSQLLNRLGLYLIGENGYFYLSKELKGGEEEKFFTSHKNVILAIAQLKRVFVHLEQGHRIKKSEFIRRFDAKRDEKILKTLFDTSDLLEITDKLFSLLEKNFVVEPLEGRDEYLVLNSIGYYLDIVEAIADEIGEEELEKEEEEELWEPSKGDTSPEMEESRERKNLPKNRKDK